MRADDLPRALGQVKRLVNASVKRARFRSGVTFPTFAIEYLQRYCLPSKDVLKTGGSSESILLSCAPTNAFECCLMKIWPVEGDPS